MTKKKKKKILIWSVSILLGGALLYSGAWLYYYYAVCLPHMPAESYGFAIDQYTPSSPGLTIYSTDMEETYWTCFIVSPHLAISAALWYYHCHWN